MNKRMIFHVPLKLQDGYVSGSTIRPQRMMKAFQEIGYKVDVVWGTSSERKIAIQKIKKRIVSGVKYDFLYAENNTAPRLIATDKHHIPRHPFVDKNFFVFLKEHNIPMGIFYRDLYWKYPKSMENLSWWKRKLIIYMQKRELAEYEQLFDVLFLPSMRCLEPLETVFSREIYPLPPAAPNLDLKESIKENGKLNVFYVGGLGYQYDLSLFLSVVREFSNIDFVLCCRTNDWEREKDKLNEFMGENIHIIHEQGIGLEKYYKNADIACLFIKPDIYIEMAMPVKLFEYLGHGLPMISVSNVAAADFIESIDAGWTLPHSRELLRSLLQELIDNPATIAEKRVNIKKALKDNTWEARAEQVVQYLRGDE